MKNKRQASKAKKILTGENSMDDRIRQNSQYRDGNKAAPDNNIFHEEFSNPLSSKGN